MLYSVRWCGNCKIHPRTHFLNKRKNDSEKATRSFCHARPGHSTGCCIRRKTMFQTILVPLDGSPRAEQALPVAAHLAQASGGTIVLLQAVHPPNEYEAYVTLQPIVTPKMLETELEEARKYLRTLTRFGSLASVHIETEVMQGDAAANILSLVDGRHIDLIVMSSHGYTGMTRWVMGSVAEKVARYAPVPVLILREGK